MLARNRQLIEEHLVGIVAGSIEERTAVDVAERVVVGHQLPQVEKIMARDIFVAHGNQQMTLRRERLAIHALAELVVDLELAVSDDKVADLRHTGPLGQMVPLVAAAVEDCRRGLL